MAENNENKYIIKIKGKEVEVNEEVYRAYVRPIRAEQRRKRREWKCNVLSKSGGHYVRCKESCETCPYYQSGNNALGNNLSLDKMAEDGVDLADPQQDVETWNRFWKTAISGMLIVSSNTPCTVKSFTARKKENMIELRLSNQYQGLIFNDGVQQFICGPW